MAAGVSSAYFNAQNEGAEDFMDSLIREKIIEVLKDNRYVKVTIEDYGHGVVEVHYLNEKLGKVVIQWVSFCPCYDGQLIGEEIFTDLKVIDVDSLVGECERDYVKAVELSDEEAEKTRLSGAEYYHDAFMYEKEVRENMGYWSVSSAYHSLYEKNVRWTCPWLIEVCKLCLEYLMLEGLPDAKRATDIPDEVQQIVGKTLTHDDLSFILSDCKGDEYQLDKESFLNFCTAMQCAEIRHADVLLILKELCCIADDNGYSKEVLRKMLDELKKD